MPLDPPAQKWLASPAPDQPPTSVGPYEHALARTCQSDGGAAAETLGRTINGTDLPSSQPQASQQTWVPRAHEYEGWPEDAQPPSTARAQAAGGEDRWEAVDGEADVSGSSRRGWAMQGRRRFPSVVRVRRPDDIRRVLRRGTRNRTAHLDVFSLDAPVSHARFGFVVGKMGRNSVARNRLRRRLREIGRLEVLPRLADCGRTVDLLVRARREAYDAPYHVLRDEVVRVTEGICFNAQF